MPTESTFLFAGLLFLAAALGYFFARFGDDESERDEGPAGRSRTALLRGFRYFLNEEPDRAVELLTESADSSEDAVEIQIALGALFRRRGEMDRAIRLHENLLQRPGSHPAQREQATLALAEDYLSAGLFDRAEELFLRLRESTLYGTTALDRLLRVAEVTNDWERAIDLSGRLARTAGDAVTPARLAHYYCELAEQARRNGQGAEVGSLLATAEDVDPGKVRTALIRADQAASGGRFADMVATLEPLLHADAALSGEVLARLYRAIRTNADRALAGELLGRVAGSPDGRRGIALAVLQDPALDEPLALEYLAAFIENQPALAALAGPDGLAGVDAAGRLSAARRVRSMLQPLLRASARYQCRSCGYGSSVRHWQCPGCRTWDSIQPLGSTPLHALLS